MSTLSKLFEYAKVSTVDARENFVTEALAGAVRLNPSPLLGALAQHGIGLEDLSSCAVYTQVSYAEAGVIDLMVQLRSSDRVREVWIEVKVDALESGDQLARYRRYIDAHAHLVDRDLVVLSKERLNTDCPLTWVAWQDLAIAIGTEAGADPVWTDLGNYLEEIRMSDSATFPMTVGEAAAMGDAVTMLNKSIRVLALVNSRIKVALPAFPEYVGLKYNSTVEYEACQQFVRHSRVTVYDNRRPAHVYYGVDLVGAEPMARVWVERNPRDIAERSKIRDWAAEKLGDSWSRPLDAWELLGKARRAILFESETEIVDWFFERLAELRDAKMLELLGTLGIPGAGGVTDIDGPEVDPVQGLDVDLART